MENQSGLILKNSSFAGFIFNGAFLIILGVIFVALTKGNPYAFGFLAFGIFTFGFGFIMSKRGKPRIIINNDGILIIEKGKLYSWKEINYAFIKGETNLNSKTSYYLMIETDYDNIRYSLSYINFNHQSVNNALEKYGARKISDESEKFFRETENLFKDNSGIIEKEKRIIYKVFRKHRQKEEMFGFLIGMPGIIGGIILQGIYQYTYVFATISSFSIILMVIISEVIGKKLKSALKEYELSDDVYEQLATKHKIGSCKKERWKGYSLAIGFFVISFLLSYFISTNL